MNLNAEDTPARSLYAPACVSTTALLAAAATSGMKNEIVADVSRNTASSTATCSVPTITLRSLGRLNGYMSATVISTNVPSARKPLDRKSVV